MRSLILVAAASLAVSACTTAQTDRVHDTVAAVCQSAPLAQIAINVALQNHDNGTVNQVIDTLRASCPAVLALIQIYPAVIVPPAPVVPTPTPERG